MTAAFIEHRPHPASAGADTTHFVIIADGKEVGSFKTQEEAKDAACKRGYRPVHVARVRHLQNRDNPDHWRMDPC
jgi:hypothetical protein